MRVVHLTDLHVQTAPSVGQLWGKRLIGTANLYLLNRRNKFTPQVQVAAVEATMELKPDLVIFTGDVSAQALPSEFEGARELLDPILSATPTVMIPGNHDTYVREPEIGQAMRRVFGEWMGPSLPHLFEHGEVCALAVETCRPHPLSAGRTPTAQLARASELLGQVGDRFCFLCLHYPLRGRRGEPYGPATRALSNARQVEEWVAGTKAIGAILHGHEHHGFRTELLREGGPIPILNPGSSGYAWMPDKDRTAHLNIYEVDRQGLHEVRRLCFDGTAFAEEPGGAYGSGR